MYKDVLEGRYVEKRIWLLFELVTKACRVDITTTCLISFKHILLAILLMVYTGCMLGQHTFYFNVQLANGVYPALTMSSTPLDYPYSTAR